MEKLIGKEKIQYRISQLAGAINCYYMDQGWYRNTQEPVVAIGVLAGSLFFMADLVRQLNIRLELDFVRISTYPGNNTKPQESKIVSLPKQNLTNAHILLVDDILDTGRTIRTIKEQLILPYTQDIKTAVLLRKPDKAPKDIVADFVGFDIPDKFVVGMGLDLNGRHREKSFISVWSEDESRASKKEAVRSK